MFKITKTFHESYLKGIVLTEVMPFEMAPGHYPSVFGYAAFEVLACEKVGA